MPLAVGSPSDKLMLTGKYSGLMLPRLKALVQNRNSRAFSCGIGPAQDMPRRFWTKPSMKFCDCIQLPLLTSQAAKSFQTSTNLGLMLAETEARVFANVILGILSQRLCGS